MEGDRVIVPVAFFEGEYFFDNKERGETPFIPPRLIIASATSLL